ENFERVYDEKIGLMSELWAATPYDTITLGPHTPGAGAILLVQGDELTEKVKKLLVQPIREKTLKVVTFATSKTAREAVSEELKKNPALWRFHDKQPNPSNLDATDLAVQKATMASAPVWVTSDRCTTGVQLIGDIQSNKATRVTSNEPVFIAELF